MAQALVALVMLYALLLAAPGKAQTATPENLLPQAVQGSLDLSALSSQDFAAPVPLAGDWTQAPGLLIMPEDWFVMQGPLARELFGLEPVYHPLAPVAPDESGFVPRQSSWRLQIALPNLEEDLALLVPARQSAWTIYVNGSIFLSAGSPGMNAGEEQAFLRPQLLRRLPADATRLDLVILESRHQVPGVANAGLPALQIAVIAEQEAQTRHVLYFLLAGMVLALTIAAFLMWLGRERRSGFLWFTLFLVTGGGHVLGVEGLLPWITPDLSPTLGLRLAMILIYPAMICLILHYQRLYTYSHGQEPVSRDTMFWQMPVLSPDSRYPVLRKIWFRYLPWSLVALNVTAMILTLVLPFDLAQQVFDLARIAVIFVAIWVILKNLQGLRQRHYGAVPALIGVVCMAAGLAHGQLLRMDFVAETGLPVPLSWIGLMIFTFCQLLVIARRYGGVLHLAEHYNRRLRRDNAALENRIGERMQQLDHSDRELRRLATTDEHTGLYNRTHFMRQSGREFQRARRFDHPMAMAIVQIDRYVDLLAEKGEEKTGIIEAETVRRLESVLRETDIAGMAGQGNVGLAMPETGLDDAIGLCQLMQTILRRDVLGYGIDDQPVTVSMAVTAVTDVDTDLSSVTMRLDRALDEVTGTGGDQLIVRKGLQLADPDPVEAAYG